MRPSYSSNCAPRSSQDWFSVVFRYLEKVLGVGFFLQESEHTSIITWGFPENGTPIAGCFLSEHLPKKLMIWGYPHGKPHILAMA